MLEQTVHFRFSSSLSVLVFVGNSPDRAAAVLADQQRTVLSDRDTNGPSPNLLIGYDETRHEVLVLAGWLAVLEPMQHVDLNGT